MQMPQHMQIGRYEDIGRWQYHQTQKAKEIDYKKKKNRGERNTRKQSDEHSKPLKKRGILSYFKFIFYS